MVWTIDVPSFTFGILVGLAFFLSMKGTYHLGKGADKNEH